MDSSRATARLPAVFTHCGRLSRNASAFVSRRRTNLASLASSLLVCLVAAEILARSLLDDGYFVWPPGLRRTARPDPTVLAGVSGPSSFSINSLGVRR